MFFCDQKKLIGIVLTQFILTNSNLPLSLMTNFTPLNIPINGRDQISINTNSAVAAVVRGDSEICFYDLIANRVLATVDIPMPIKTVQLIGVVCSFETTTGRGMCNADGLIDYRNGDAKVYQLDSKHRFERVGNKRRIVGLGKSAELPSSLEFSDTYMVHLTTDCSALMLEHSSYITLYDLVTMNQVKIEPGSLTNHYTTIPMSRGRFCAYVRRSGNTTLFIVNVTEPYVTRVRTFYDVKSVIFDEVTDYLVVRYTYVSGQTLRGEISAVKPDGTIVWTQQDRTGPIRHVAGARLFVSAYDGMILMFDFETGEIVHTIDTQLEGSWFSFGPRHSNRMVVLTDDLELHYTDLEQKEESVITPPDQA
jgi:hypothetical protein